MDRGGQGGLPGPRDRGPPVQPVGGRRRGLAPRRHRLGHRDDPGDGPRAPDPGRGAEIKDRPAPERRRQLRP